MRSQPLPNLLATPYVFHRLEPVTERLATEQLPAVLDAESEDLVPQSDRNYPCPSSA